MGAGLHTTDTLPLSAELVLVHRRLSIVDIAGGRQPMCNEDRTVWVAFNGEIYNHAVLRRELERRGHRFETTCDTEVLVHGWEEWQEDVLSRLNGIFAICLYDARTDEIVLARDPVGVKPLYVGASGDLVWWASELGAAFNAGLVPRTISPDALKLFLLFRYIPSPWTIYGSAWKVPPGHYMRFERRQARGWSPEFRPYGSTVTSSADPRGRRQWREALVEEFESAVDRQLMADVRVGSLLSGGVDSSLITSVMARRLPYLPMTFGIGFSSSGAASEAAAARLAAADLGVPHRSIELSDDEYLAAWPQSFREIGEPLANGGGLLIHLLCRLAAEDNKVVLTGQGADEPLGGYSRHVVERLYGLGRFAPRLVSRLARPVLGAESAGRLRRALAQSNRVDRYVEIFSGLGPSEVDRLVPGEAAAARDLARDAIARWVADDPEADPLNELLRIDVRMSLADDLLLVADHHSMRASVELRVPFLDLGFLELVERMPSHYKVSWLGERKWLYREGAAGRLPPPLRRRVCGPVARIGRKQGFTAPLVTWFGGKGTPSTMGRDWTASLSQLTELSTAEALAVSAGPDDGRHARRHSSLYALAQWVDAYCAEPDYLHNG